MLALLSAAKVYELGLEQGLTIHVPTELCTPVVVPGSKVPVLLCLHAQVTTPSAAAAPADPPAILS